MKQPLVRRRDVTQATLHRFRDKPFQMGTRDCVRMTAAHLRAMGYKVKLPPSGSYRTLRSATKALATAGFETIGAALDAMGLPRIPPAAALPGDVIELPSENNLAALAIALGNGRIVAYHPDMPGATVLQPLDFVTAWRVDPR